ncbi:DNA (cytosine-5-)-methyltransferase [[Eubacterium] yurii subsp. margaretiae ATCC 43715]|nr:DNA (cytosine-5-)-methyltransferase [[Eubacterium] yurii subsp. margaretiae ATCC 43715]
MNKNIFEIVEEVLKTNSKYISDDGKLLKAIVYSDVMTMDKELLHLLLSNEKIKERFFEDVNGTLIFDKQGFAWFIESKEFLPDSYTRYTNKIGLTNGGDFISKSNDVVLDFPYKDCVLEGGQDKEDQKRKEIFYNETIASDEISKMLAPKVFTNAKRYTKDGVEDNVTFDENDNLIIKGNNLIALSSLLKRYEGKVKCIYIDPPYNTGSDSFNYNDAFNHSGWLTFMKNRLELAKRLLRETGVIFVQCDDNEQAYAKVLMDEIFGINNFVAEFPRVTKRGGKSSSVIANNHDYVLMCAKNKHNVKIYAPKHDDDKFNQKDKYFAERGYYKLNQTLDYDSLQYSKSLDYPIELEGKTLYPGGDYNMYQKRQNGEHRRADWAWRWSENLFNFGLANGFIVLKEGKDRPRIYTKTYQKVKIVDNNGEYTIVNIDRTKPLSTIELTNNIYSNDNATKHAELLGIKNIFDYTKPEFLIRELISLAADKNDIVLDFHLGSGTTCAVAHKMGRRYIGVEQMDYIQNITVERMKKVIDGEQGGISKSADWQGGGSFIYCELLENASTLIEKIQAASEETISKIKKEIYVDERIIPYITREELEKADEEFNSLKLEEKKKALISLVDKNKLYVNYSDMDDESYAISESDKAFTKSFYAEV